MSTALAELTNQVLSLPVEERVVLAHLVWDSVEHFADAETQKAWMDEAERRWREIEEGRVQCVPADEAMRKARAAITD